MRSPRCRATCVIAIDYDELRELVMMAMSLADRPRPALLQVRSDPQGPAVHLRLAAARGADAPRAAPRSRCCSRMRSGARSPAGRSSSATATSRSSATPNISTRRRRRPTPTALDAAVVEMVRGWAPAVEAELIDAAGAPRATRLALTYINSLPRRLSRPHRARGRRRRHPAPVPSSPTTTTARVRISRARRTTRPGSCG